MTHGTDGGDTFCVVNFRVLFMSYANDNDFRKTYYKFSQPSEILIRNKLKEWLTSS